LKKVHKSWKLTLGTVLIFLLLAGSYVYTAILIIDLETERKAYTDRIAELEYKMLSCRLSVMNELIGAEIRIIREPPEQIKDIRVEP
jgi:hypothetical protein